MGQQGRILPEAGRQSAHSVEHVDDDAFDLLRIS